MCLLNEKLIKNTINGLLLKKFTSELEHGEINLNT